MKRLPPTWGSNLNQSCDIKITFKMRPYITGESFRLTNRPVYELVRKVHFKQN